MKNAIVTALLLVTLFYLTGCAPEKKDLVGRWYLVEAEINGMDFPGVPICPSKRSYIEFLDSGRGAEVKYNQFCETTFAEEFDYGLDQWELTTAPVGTGVRKRTLKILKLDAEKLTLHLHVDETDRGGKVVDIISHYTKDKDFRKEK